MMNARDIRRVTFNDNVSSTCYIHKKKKKLRSGLFDWAPFGIQLQSYD